MSSIKPNVTLSVRCPKSQRWEPVSAAEYRIQGLYIQDGANFSHRHLKCQISTKFHTERIITLSQYINQSRNTEESFPPSFINWGQREAGEKTGVGCDVGVGDENHKPVVYSELILLQDKLRYSAMVPVYVCLSDPSENSKPGQPLMAKSPLLF